jgi:hypothetical protein
MRAAPATFPLLADNPQQLVDFMRRLATVMAGGRNAERLLDAASLIEALSRRAASTEQSFHELQEDHANNLERRDIAELASDNMMVEIAKLKAQLAERHRIAEAEIAALKGEIAGREAQAELDRARFAEEALGLQAAAHDVQTRLDAANASIEALRNPVKAVDGSAVVPLQTLQTARDQFAFLAAGFAKAGDLISQTICEVGACAIDKTIGGKTAEGG